MTPPLSSEESRLTQNPKPEMPVGEREIGPKTIELACPKLENGFPKIEGQREVQVNTGPRAKQAWRIENVYFNFPNAEKLAGGAVVQVQEFEFEISMFIGGVEVAKQKFLETAKLGEEASPMHLVGSLEPFSSAIVYPGQDVRFVYRLKKDTTSAFQSTGEGAQIVMNYSLVTKTES